MPEPPGLFPPLFGPLASLFEIPDPPDSIVAALPSFVLCLWPHIPLLVAAIVIVPLVVFGRELINAMKKDRVIHRIAMQSFRYVVYMYLVFFIGGIAFWGLGASGIQLVEGRGTRESSSYGKEIGETVNPVMNPPHRGVVGGGGEPWMIFPPHMGWNREKKLGARDLTAMKGNLSTTAIPGQLTSETAPAETGTSISTSAPVKEITVSTTLTVFPTEEVSTTAPPEESSSSTETEIVITLTVIPLPAEPGDPESTESTNEIRSTPGPTESSTINEISTESKTAVPTESSSAVETPSTPAPTESSTVSETSTSTKTSVPTETSSAVETSSTPIPTSSKCISETPTSSSAEQPTDGTTITITSTGTSTSTKFVTVTETETEGFPSSSVSATSGLASSASVSGTSFVSGTNTASRATSAPFSERSSSTSAVLTSKEESYISTSTVVVIITSTVLPTRRPPAPPFTSQSDVVVITESIIATITAPLTVTRNSTTLTRSTHTPTGPPTVTPHPGVPIFTQLASGEWVVEPYDPSPPQYSIFCTGPDLTRPVSVSPTTTSPAKKSTVYSGRISVSAPVTRTKAPDLSPTGKVEAKFTGKISKEEWEGEVIPMEEFGEEEKPPKKGGVINEREWQSPDGSKPERFGAGISISRELDGGEGKIPSTLEKREWMSPNGHIPSRYPSTTNDLNANLQPESLSKRALIDVDESRKEDQPLYYGIWYFPTPETRRKHTKRDWEHADGTPVERYGEGYQVREGEGDKAQALKKLPTTLSPSTTVRAIAKTEPGSEETPVWKFPDGTEVERHALGYLPPASEIEFSKYQSEKYAAANGDVKAMERASKDAQEKGRGGGWVLVPGQGKTVRCDRPKRWAVVKEGLRGQRNRVGR